MIMTVSKQPSISILRLNKLCEKIGLGKSAIYDRLDKSSPRYDPDFPPPIKLGKGKNPPVGWISTEVDVWLELQIQHTRAAGVLL
jgi:prophage regulatory protein